jgi:hypothetical protein
MRRSAQSQVRARNEALLRFRKGDGCGGYNAAAVAFLNENDCAQVCAVPLAGRGYGYG